MVRVFLSRGVSGTLLVLLMGFSFVLAQTQSNYQISGRILNAQNEAKVGIDVFATLGGVLQAQTTTDERGNFSFGIASSGTLNIVFREKGIEKASRVIELKDNISPDPLEISIKGLQRLDIVVANPAGEIRGSEKKVLQVSTFDRSTIEENSISDLNDLSGASANFYVLDTGSTSSVYLTMRGLTSIGTIDPIVVFYVDGVAKFQSLNSPLQLVNIESLEIYKGSQNTLFGRNAFAGVIDIRTYKPENRFSGNASVELDSKLKYLLSVNLSTPIWFDLFSFRAGGFFSGYDGNVYNQTLEKRVGGHQNFSTYLDLFFILSPEIELTVSGSLEQIDEEAFSYLLHGSGDFYRGRELAFNHPYNVRYNEPNRNKRETGEVTVVLNIENDDFNMVSVTSYQNSSNLFIIDTDFLSDPIGRVDFTTGSHVLTEEIKFFSTDNTSRFLDWTVGSFLYYQQRNNLSEISVNSGIIQGIDNAFIRVDTIQNYMGIAFYLSLSIPLSTKVALVIGNRIDLDLKTENIDGDSGDNEEELEDNVDFKKIKFEWFYTPKVALNFQFDEGFSMYLSVGRGFRNGGMNPFVTDEANVFYNQESSWQSEVGLKSRHPNFLIDTSAFFTYWQNQQVNVFFEGSIFEFGLYNAERSYSTGFDIEADIPIYFGVSFGGSLGYVKAKVIKMKDPSDGETIMDKKQPFVPDLTSMIAVKHQYDLKIGNIDFSHINRIEYRYVSSLYYDYTNTILSDGYGLLNFSSTIRIYSFVVNIFFKNILDTRYVAFSLPFGAATPISLGEPLTFGSKISFYF